VTRASLHFGVQLPVSQGGPGALRRPGALGPGQAGRRGLGSPTRGPALG
jgi:hypothetical protein